MHIKEYYRIMKECSIRPSDIALSLQSTRTAITNRLWLLANRNKSKEVPLDILAGLYETLKRVCNKQNKYIKQIGELLREENGQQDTGYHLS